LYKQTPLAAMVIGLPQWLQTTTRQRLPSLVVTVWTGIAFYTKQPIVIVPAKKSLDKAAVRQSKLN
jgi:hypothetical protein